MSFSVFNLVSKNFKKKKKHERKKKLKKKEDQSLTERRGRFPPRPVPQKVRRQADLVRDLVDVRQGEQTGGRDLGRGDVGGPGVPGGKADAGLLGRAKQEELASDRELRGHRLEVVDAVELVVSDLELACVGCLVLSVGLRGGVEREFSF